MQFLENSLERIAVGRINTGQLHNVQVAAELLRCTQEHDKMLLERQEHEDRLRRVCS